ncbi:hypothetical protein C8J57DRAFT_1247869 [Mycena rebaudengoi]|nr:hypothetical protein C8J57DRAFT_1247869 [Mycena rebaudengoi]
MWIRDTDIGNPQIWRCRKDEEESVLDSQRRGNMTQIIIAARRIVNGLWGSLIGKDVVRLEKMWPRLKYMIFGAELDDVVRLPHHRRLLALVFGFLAAVTCPARLLDFRTVSSDTSDAPLSRGGSSVNVCALLMNAQPVLYNHAATSDNYDRTQGGSGLGWADLIPLAKMVSAYYPSLTTRRSDPSNWRPGNGRGHWLDARVIWTAKGIAW